MNTACGVARNLYGLTWALLLPSLAGAQVANDGQSAVFQARTVLADVVVSAQRRDERLQAVPISATVLTAAQLELQRVGKLHELQYAVPNLQMAQNRSSGTTATIAIRGQVELETTPTVDPAVGLYLGGVYIARTTGANLELIDVERVEVLRGPQGTLFGRNTTGGAINLVPREPSFELEGLLEANLGNYDLAEFTAVLNAPMAGDRMATRLVASHAGHDGYARNTLLGASLDDEVVDYVRAQVVLLPSDRSELLLSFDGSRSRTNGQLLTLLDVAPAADTLPAVFGNPADLLTNYLDPYSRQVAADRIGPASTSVWGTSGALTLEFSRFTLKSITAYRELELSASNVDQDATPYDLGVILHRGDTQHQFTQELQAYGSAQDGRLQWIGGIHYFNEQATYQQQLRLYVPVTGLWRTGMPAGDVHNDSLAAYGQLTYAITPQLRVTGGGRFNRDGRQLTSRNQTQIGDVVCNLHTDLRDETEPCQATLPERSFEYAPWMIAVDYEPTVGAMLYAKLSQGHRAGGYNIRGTNAVDLDTFEPEQVTSIELGAKVDLLDHRLRLNMALFRSAFEDIQLTQLEPGSAGPGSVIRYIENGGRARIEGGEVEVTALLGSLRLGFGYGATRPQFTELDEKVEGVTLDSRFPMVPDWSATVSADWVRAIGSWELDAHADYAWRDDVLFSFNADSAARQEAFGLLNAAIAVRPPHRNLELRLWARNLADQRYVERAFETEYFVTAAPGDPRTYGASLAYRFGEQ
jgi:iron complex outermembrane receptor protein